MYGCTEATDSRRKVSKLATKKGDSAMLENFIKHVLGRVHVIRSAWDVFLLALLVLTGFL